MRARDASRLRRGRIRGRVTAPGGLRAAIQAFAAALLLAAWARPVAAQAVVGRVIDAESGTAIPGARISVIGRGESHQAVTDADGRYSIALAGSGAVHVRAARTGYEAGRSRAVPVAAGDTVQVDLRLQPEAVPLRALKATVRRPRLDVRGKFHALAGGDPAALRPVSAAGRARSIQAQGTMVAPTGCYRLAGAAERTGSVVTLNVQARPEDDGCPESPTAFSYRVTVRGLPPGSYTFRILHTYRNAVWGPAMAMDTTIAVP